MDRILALDYGQKRIGVAFSDPLHITAQAQDYVENNRAVIESLKVIIESSTIKSIILGLPKDQHGGEGLKAEEVRRFAKRLKKAFQLPIDFVDERFSTVAVQKHLVSADVSRKKRKEVVDSQAAAFFLQGYLDSRSRSNKLE